jgi:cytochrome c oxidase subunit III
VRRIRPVIDVSRLPTVVFGHRTLEWWGTLGFMLIEGVTLALATMSYLYLRKNYAGWPPEGTALPDLSIPIIQIVVMLASCVPAILAKRRSYLFDRKGTALWLWVSSAFGVLILVLRWFELTALNTRWDSHAYGSAAWLIVGIHGTLVLLDLFDTLGLALLMSADRAEPRHYPATADNTDYWLFIMLSWIPLATIVYFSPRWL